MSQKNINTPYSINNIHDAKNIKIILSKDPNKPVNLNDSNVQKSINIFVANKIYVHSDAFKGVGVSDKGLNIQDYSQINDLAIIELSNPLDTNTVEVATVSQNNPAIGSEELIIGYGVDNGPGVIISDPFNGASGILRSAIAKIDSFSGNNSIINLLGTVNNGDGYTHICQGDSGGPDLININNKYTIQGVHSFGEGSECGTPSSPGSSINVASYYNWIKNDYKNSSLQK
jgi:secreted trypsin-like serine protease